MQIGFTGYQRFRRLQPLRCAAEQKPQRCFKLTCFYGFPYYFEENKERYKKYLDKIIHLRIDNPPEVLHENDWSVENYQRSYLLKGIAECHEDDIICLSDIDELYDPDLLIHPEKYQVSPINYDWGWKTSLKQFFHLLGTNKRILRKNSMKHFLNYTPVSVRSMFCKYYLNFSSYKTTCNTIITKFKNIQNMNTLRGFKETLPATSIAKGWHFSSMGGKEQVLSKIEGVIEGHFEKDFLKDKRYEDELKKCLNNGIMFNTAPDNRQFHLISLQELNFPNIQGIEKKYPHLFYSE